tara:strand:+ start:137 stop:766 length:630 start_codon:yes stop_codon:yes gene_type:complete
MSIITLNFKGSGGEFQYHRLNKKEVDYLRNEFMSDEDSFLEMHLQGGESFETSIWPGSYGPSIDDLEIINDENNEMINLESIEKNEVFFADDESDYKKNCLHYYYITEGTVFGSIRINLSEDEKFDPANLTINYIKYELYESEKHGTIIAEVKYNDETCEIETEDNGQDIFRSLIGCSKINARNHCLESAVIYDSESWQWDLYDKIFED